MILFALLFILLLLVLFFFFYTKYIEIEKEIEELYDMYYKLYPHSPKNEIKGKITVLKR